MFVTYFGYRKTKRTTRRGFKSEQEAKTAEAKQDYSHIIPTMNYKLFKICRK
nr:Arm DNA-binding domain-containing protein [Staphylococcus xylosus]